MDRTILDGVRILPILILLFTTPLLHAAEVPLDVEISFEATHPKLERTATLVVSDELQGLVVTHKRLVSRFDFSIGKAATSQLTRALESRYEKVELISVRPDQWEGPLFELTSVDVKPKFPRTTFGSYGAVLDMVVTVREHDSESVLTLSHEGSSKDPAARVLFQSPISAMKQDWVKLGKATGAALTAALDELLTRIGQGETPATID